MVSFRHKRLIVGSVAVPPYTNYGNRLIEQATFSLLNLPPDTPRFSVFQKISDGLLDFINTHDCLVITGCTTLQDDPGHQACFDRQFAKITIPKICFGGGFYCDFADTPSLRIARMYDTPIGARDPWSAEFLAKHGIECYLIGCPTLIASPAPPSWLTNPGGPVLVSSTPVLQVDDAGSFDRTTVRYVKHDPWSPGEELTDFTIFDGASLVITGRLHAALPAVARGIRVRFYDQNHWHPEYKTHSWGTIRYTLLSYLGLTLDGRDASDYPHTQLDVLTSAYRTWLDRVFPS